MAKDYDILKVKLGEMGNEYKEKFSGVSEVIRENLSPKEISHHIANLPGKLSHFLSEVPLPDLVLVFLIQHLKDSLSDIKKSYFDLIDRIDSEEYDWMELYKEDPNHIKVNVPRWPIFVFLFSAFLCLFFSSSYHLFYVKNLTVSKYMRRMDYAGISILIAGSTSPGYFYGFFCNQFFALLYVGYVLSTCSVVFVISMTNWFHDPKNLHLKSFIYGGLGISAAFPMIHLVVNELILK